MVNIWCLAFQQLRKGHCLLVQVVADGTTGGAMLAVVLGDIPVFLHIAV